MSGSTPTVAGATTTTGVALLPNTGGNRVLLVVALVALGFGLITLAITGAVSLKQRMNRA
jgi:hypothetical protein